MSVNYKNMIQQILSNIWTVTVLQQEQVVRSAKVVCRIPTESNGTPAGTQKLWSKETPPRGGVSYLIL